MYRSTLRTTRHRLIDQRPAREALDVPALALTIVPPQHHRRRLVKEAAGVGIQVATFVLQHGNHVFALAEDVVEHGAVGIQRIAEDDVKGPRIGGDHPVQQTGTY